MSLIQDALRRQAEETAGARLPGQPIEQPPAPPPPPEKEKPKALSPQEKKKPKAFPIVPLILFLVVFLAALLGLSLYLLKPNLKTVPKVTQESVPVEPVALPAVPEPAKVLTVESIVESVAPPLVTEQEADPVQKIKKTWPELKLTGIAQGGDRQRLAILNGKMLSAGRRLGEVAVIQVRDSTVIVEYRGERRTLYIGE
jgi:hypothetical protein